MAKIIARTINCENLVDATPCNKCVNCTQNTTDIIEIDAASNNGVDEIRELKNKISLVPTYGKYKIYIIDEVHMLTISAFNALLKTLEEPPKHIIFILATTDPEKVPPTIISRCQRFDFKRITIDAILNRLKQICKEENIEIEDNALYEIARISDGGLRDAVNLLDQAYSYTDGKITINEIHELNGTLTSYEIEEFFKYYLDNDLVTILNKITDYNNIGKNLVKLAQEFMVFLRNTVIYIKAPNYLEENNIDTKPYISISQSLGADKILMLINELNKTINDMKISQNPKLIFELLFIKNVGNKNISQEVNSGKNATNQANVIKEEENFEKLYNESLNEKKFDKRITGTVIQISRKGEIFVDFKYKADGIIPRKEYSDDETKNPKDEFKPGDTITADVIKWNDGLGNVLLSYKKYRREEDKKIERELKIKQAEEIKRQKIERAKNIEEFWNNIKIGKAYKGTVSKIVDYGIFVDLGVVTGLAHKSELVWDKNEKIEGKFQVGDEIEVKIKDFNKEERRISLEYPLKGENPWFALTNKYKINDIVTCKVVKFAPFGAFVEIEKGLEGLVHNSEITGLRRVVKPEDELKIGQTVNAKIINIDKEKLKIGLSIKEIEGTSAEYGYEEYISQ